MVPIREIAPLVGGKLAELGVLRLNDFGWNHRDPARLAIGVVVAVAFAALIWHYIRSERPGRRRLAVPALLPGVRRSYWALGRQGPLLLFLAGVPFLAIALADPYTAFKRTDVSYPGRRISLMIDASTSMMAGFSTPHLDGRGNLFNTSTAAAGYFMRLRMNGKYRDLIALVEFGDQAYVITPFTSDYENILLSLSLIEDLTEYTKFPDKGTTISSAIDQSVSLFRAFDFLHAAGNVMVIFSDGQDSQVKFEGKTLNEVLEGAVTARIPIYFIRIGHNKVLGDLVPDAIWKAAVERTGGRFYAAPNEAMIMSAAREIDRLTVGRVEMQEYSVHRPRFDSYALMAVALWTTALALQLTMPYFGRFP